MVHLALLFQVGEMISIQQAWAECTTVWHCGPSPRSDTLLHDSKSEWCEKLILCVKKLVDETTKMWILKKFE